MMAFIRCKKHPEIVMHRVLDANQSDEAGVPIYEPGLRCWVCHEIRPLKAEIIALQRAAKFKNLPPPGEGMCQNCTVYHAEAEIEFMAGGTLRLCRSCTGVVRTRLKAAFKEMEKRATALNKKRGVTR